VDKKRQAKKVLKKGYYKNVVYKQRVKNLCGQTCGQIPCGQVPCGKKTLYGGRANAPCGQKKQAKKICGKIVKILWKKNSIYIKG